MGEVFLYGNGGNDKVGSMLTVTATAPVGAMVTISKDGKSKTKVADSDGIAVFKGLESGEWMVTITDGVYTDHKTISVESNYYIELTLSAIPKFTYTGNYKVVNDDGEPDNWKIRFLTSGTLTFTELRSAVDGIDIFLVGGGGGGGHGVGGPSGGGGGGGGGGYTNVSNTVPTVNMPYEIVIGAGGAGSGYIGGGGKGGSTSAFGFTASGGNGGSGSGSHTGGSGGSGGGGGSVSSGNPGRGGYDGSNGFSGGSGSGGKGQGTTTREFHEPSGKRYSGGGGGGSYGNPAIGGDGGGGSSGSAGSTNTGGGGGGHLRNGGYGSNGGSGIVIIRKKR